MKAVALTPHNNKRKGQRITMQAQVKIKTFGCNYEYPSLMENFSELGILLNTKANCAILEEGLVEVIIPASEETETTEEIKLVGKVARLIKDPLQPNVKSYGIRFILDNETINVVEYNKYMILYKAAFTKAHKEQMAKAS